MLVSGIDLDKILPSVLAGDVISLIDPTSAYGCLAADFNRLPRRRTDRGSDCVPVNHGLKVDVIPEVQSELRLQFIAGRSMILSAAAGDLQCAH